MASKHTRLAVLISATLIAVPAFASHVHRSPTAGRASTATTARAAHRTAGAFRGSSRRLAKKPVAKLRGQQAIAPERAEQIQQALIRAHYLNGEANGVWDEGSIAAMQKFQADQGWQTKLMPDPRALIKLGLGPDYSSAINSGKASVTSPQSDPSGTSASLKPSRNEGFVAASGVSQ